MSRRYRGGAAVVLSLAGLLGSSLLLLPMIVLVAQVNWSTLASIWFASGGMTALWTSLWTATSALLIILLFGTPIAWLLARRSSPLWNVVEFLLLIPLLMPPLVIGLLLVFLYGPYGPIGAWLAHFNLSATNTALAVLIAQIYEAAPYYIAAAQSTFAQLDRSLERASLTLGRSPGYTFRRIALPLSLPGLIAAATVAFARAIGAFGAVIVMAYYPHTLPVSIWVALQEQGLPAALPLALLLTIVSLPLPLLAVLWRRWRHAAL